MVESSWNVMAHGDAREGKWRGNWRMVWVASTLHTTSEHGVSSVTTADAHTSAASNWLTWRPRRFKWTCLFRWKMKCGFCACAFTFHLASTTCDLFADFVSFGYRQGHWHQTEFSWFYSVFIGLYQKVSQTGLCLFPLTSFPILYLLTILPCHAVLFVTESIVRP
jgi:hypothetical protein